MGWNHWIGAQTRLNQGTHHGLDWDQVSTLGQPDLGVDQDHVAEPQTGWINPLSFVKIEQIFFEGLLCYFWNVILELGCKMSKEGDLWNFHELVEDEDITPFFSNRNTGTKICKRWRRETEGWSTERIHTHQKISYRMKKKITKRTRFLNNHGMLISLVSPTLKVKQIKSLTSR